MCVCERGTVICVRDRVTYNVCVRGSVCKNNCVFHTGVGREVCA